eukprot:NODE_342_length_975_cov_261.415767_g297_i0.p1 GENE.NODE_342_length_975_cov_261.415767_g297_i0~~NODE_342_length_975_cov_261.415767_g297_i0.p1  ORF type:complete len:83 (-),score=22.93 NODE_342_length_975_cov_261.415767_g297_i0:496-744(-)
MTGSFCYPRIWTVTCKLLCLGLSYSCSDVKVFDGGLLVFPLVSLVLVSLSSLHLVLLSLPFPSFSSSSPFLLLSRGCLVVVS